jgi:plasmanylethanolamine desaturase
MKAIGAVLRAVTGEYDYSPWYRLVELSAIAATVALLGVLAWRVMLALGGMVAASTWLVLAAACLVGYVGSDLVSGVVHWMADRIGDADTPVLGAAFIEPFREHHVTPKEICEHDFVEVNGNNCLVLLLVLVPVLVMTPEQLTSAWVGWAGFWLSFSVGIFMTNQFHQWAHADDPPAIARLLQRCGIILPPDAHDRHHTAPYETDYCITSGWLNPLLERLDVFARLEEVFGIDPDFDDHLAAGERSQGSDHAESAREAAEPVEVKGRRRA